MNATLKCMSVLLAIMPAALPSTAEAQVRRYISVDSHCSQALRFYISHADGWRNWHAHGPYNFAAYEGPTRLDNDGVTLTQTEDHDLYIYAETLNGSRRWEGSHSFELRGVNYPMQRANVTVIGGELRVKLTCP